MPHRLKPKITVLWEDGYSWNRLLRDVMAGTVVAIMALPLSIAFAVASNARPEDGLMTAIVAGFVGGLLSGSRVQITGPTGAFVILVASTIAQYGYEGLLIATVMAGVILLGLGLARLGTAIRFIPHAAVVGMTAGLAILIFTTQLRDVLGLQTGALPISFTGKWRIYGASITTVNWSSIALATCSLLITASWPARRTRIPGALIAILVTSMAALYFGLPAEMLGDRFGAISATIPVPHFPAISLARLAELIGPAIAIALLAGIESLLSAVVADGLTGKRHRSNMELISQGMCNIGCALFGGIPATGTIARTSANVRAGAATPVASIVQALLLLLMLLFLGKTLVQIPLAGLAGIIIYVAYNMCEWRHLASILRGPRWEVACLLATFLFTVFVDLVVGIAVGTALALGKQLLTRQPRVDVQS